jgi:hypothetical protein
MLKGLLIGAAALIASAQAQAAVVYEQTGVTDSMIYIAPPLGNKVGYYRLNIWADGANKGFWVVRLYEWWTVYYYENGQLIDVGETGMEFTPYGSIYTRSPGFQRTEFNLPSVRDFRNAELTGSLVEVTSRGFQADFLLFPEKPTPFRVTIEIFDAAPVPEPASWALMIIGFGAAGSAARRSKGSRPNEEALC